jgi:hypothetical protein
MNYMYINLIITVLIILIIFILINKTNKEKFSVQSDTDFVNNYCKTYCDGRDSNYNDGFGTSEECSTKCKDNIDKRIAIFKNGSSQAQKDLFSISLNKQLVAKDEIIRTKDAAISSFNQNSILKSNVDGIKALGYILQDDCTFEPTTELCAIAKTDIKDKKTINTQSENGEQAWGLIGTSEGEYGKIGDGTSDNEYGKIGTSAGEYGKIGTNLGEYMSVNQCKTATSASNADIKSQCTVANANDRNSYITKTHADIEKQNAIKDAEEKLRADLECVVEIAKNRNDFMRVDDCVLTPKKYAEATRTLGTDNKFTITTPDVAGKKWVEISQIYKDNIQVKIFENQKLQNYLINRYRPTDKSKYNANYQIELSDTEFTDIGDISDLLYSDYVEIEIELDDKSKSKIMKYFKPVKNDDQGGIDKEWGLIGNDDNQYLLRSDAKAINWCDTGNECKPIDYIDPTKCTFDMIPSSERQKFIQSSECSIKKTDLYNHMKNTPPDILNLSYNDGAPDSEDIDSRWGKIYPNGALNEQDKNGYYGKIGTESDNYMIRSECSVTSDQFNNWMQINDCALTYDNKGQQLAGNNANGPLKITKEMGSVQEESWGKIGTQDNQYGKIGDENGEYGVIGQNPSEYMKNSDCGINNNAIEEDSKLITAKNGTSWGKVSDSEGGNEGNDGYYGVIGDYNSGYPDTDNKYMKNSECAISTNSIVNKGPITTRDGLSKWGKISDVEGTEGLSTYYGLIGSRDYDYIKNDVCNSQKDDHLNENCKLTKNTFDSQTRTTPNKITVDSDNWGLIGDEETKYGEIGSKDGKYMLYDNCHTLQSDVDLNNNTAIAKNQTYWGKIGDDAISDKHGDEGYYGLIGIIDDYYGKIGRGDDDYVKNSECAIYQSDTISGNGPITTRDGLSEWGKIYPDNAQNEQERNGYYGKIGNGIGNDEYGKIGANNGEYGKIGIDDNDYIIRSQANTNTQESLYTNCEFLSTDVSNKKSMSGKNGRDWGLIGDEETKYGEIGDTGGKYMLYDDCAIESSQITTNGPIRARGGSNWGKIYPDNAQNEEERNGYYGKIGDGTGDNEYGKIGTSADEYGKIGTIQGEYGKIGDGTGDNEYGKIGTSADEYGKIGTESGEYGIIGSAPGEYGKIGQGTLSYMLYNNCHTLQGDVSGNTANAIDGSQWGKVSDVSGNHRGNNDYYGLIGESVGEYGLIGTNNQNYMQRQNCLYEDPGSAIPNIISLRNKQGRWGKIGTEGLEYITNNEAVSDTNGSLSTDCEFIKNEVLSKTSMPGKDGRNWGLIGDQDSNYMLKSECGIESSQISISENGPITIDGSNWGKIGNIMGQYGKIGDGSNSNDYGKIGSTTGDYIKNSVCDGEKTNYLNDNCKLTKNTFETRITPNKITMDSENWGLIGNEETKYGEIGNTNGKYMLYNNCAIESSQISGKGPITTRDGTSKWGKILDTGTANSAGTPGYYGEIGLENNKYGKIGEGTGTYMLYNNCHTLQSNVSGNTANAINDTKWGKVSDNQAGRNEGAQGYYGEIRDYNSGDPQTDNKYMKNSECAIGTNSMVGKGPITTRDGHSNWGKISDTGTPGYYGEIGNLPENYVKLETISQLQNTIQQYFDGIEIESIDVKNPLYDHIGSYSWSNFKAFRSGWFSGNIITGDVGSKITIFAYNCKRETNIKEKSNEISILKIFKGNIGHFVVDDDTLNKRYIFYKDENRGNKSINLYQQLGDYWTNVNIGNNISGDSYSIGCVEIQKKN